MDPFSLATGVIQVAEFAFQICNNLYAFFSSTINAPIDAAKLRGEILQVFGLLKALQSILENGQHALRSAKNGTLQESLSALRVVLEEIDERIKPRRTKGLRRLVWPFRQDEIVRLLARIERCKTTLLCALVTENMYPIYFLIDLL